MTQPAAVVVLAAGQGTRMRSQQPKVLHRIGGRSLLGHVLAAVRPLDAASTLVVVGHGRDEVTAELAAVEPTATPVVQAEQRGTGHAVRTALDEVPDVDGVVVVVPGDAPLLTADTLRALVRTHVEQRAATTLLTAELPDPTGYGRVVRRGAAPGTPGPADAPVQEIVEQRDADDDTLAIREVAVSVYAFDAARLRSALGRLSTDNAQGEEYLTDVVALHVADGEPVAALRAADWQETVGVNDRAQLAEAGRALRDRVVQAAMRAGVTVVDPATTWVDADVTLEPDATLLPSTQLHGRTVVRAGAVVGPSSTLTDTVVGAGAHVSYAVCAGADIGESASVGPFTYLRPGTVLGPRTKAGSYVEVKGATVGADSKVPHLSYVGDAAIGERSNIGAATVFVNYDGVSKHRTEVGDDVRIGSDTMLVAPVRVGDGAYTAAGSVIDSDVPPGALGIGRARQRNVEGWVERRRAGTPAAQAAARRRTSETAAGSGDSGSADHTDAVTPTQ